MGYRSEVKSLVYGTSEQMAKFKADNAELWEVLAEDFGENLSGRNLGKYEMLYLNLEYSKWYDSYSEVIRWNNLLTLAQDADLATEFVRIGEDSEGDIETDYTGDCEYYLQTECHIVANF
jgi:hypothetical protein